MQAVKQFDGRLKSLVGERPEQHDTSPDGKKIHYDVESVAEQREPECLVSSCIEQAGEGDRRDGGNGNRYKQTMGQIVVIFPQVPEKDSE